jgi:hypothetical protein
VLILSLFAVAPEASVASAKISFEGYGAARWGEPVQGVEAALGVSFDCSGGAIPGECLCPPAEPELPVVLAFDVRGTPRLSSLFTIDPGVSTDRGIHVGSYRWQVRMAYPSGRLVRGGLGGGLSTYYLIRHDGHAIAIEVGARRVKSIDAFANAHHSSITSETCA